MFWSLKQSLRDTFGSLSKTPSCLMHIVTFADNRLQERYTYNGLKSLKIYDQGEFVRKLNEEAADLLNDRGCIVFHQALKLYQEKKLNLSYRGNLVIESFGESESYQATSSTCNCTYYKEFQSPCIHVIYIRSVLENLQTFEKQIFHMRYHRSEDHSTDIPGRPNDVADDVDFLRQMQSNSTQTKWTKVMNLK